MDGALSSRTASQNILDCRKFPTHHVRQAAGERRATGRGTMETIEFLLVFLLVLPLATFGAGTFRKLARESVTS